MLSPSHLLTFAAAWTLATAHSVIVYPGWRGDNLDTTGFVDQTQGLGVDYENGSLVYPYGKQWIYPCGGMPQTTNRTKWPTTGGAVAVQPGWFQGHLQAFFYINLGLGTIPPNMSHVMQPVFNIGGPTNNPYNGTFCLPQVGLPANLSVQAGDNATIQVVETAQHGAALYSCVDITFADPDDPEIPEVTPQNCFNSTTPGQQINIGYVYYTDTLSSAASKLLPSFGTLLAILPALAAVAYFGL